MGKTNKKHTAIFKLRLTGAKGDYGFGPGIVAAEEITFTPLSSYSEDVGTAVAMLSLKDEFLERHVTVEHEMVDGSERLQSAVPAGADMRNKCLAGINKDTSEVQVVSDFDPINLVVDMVEIEEAGCYAVIADKALAKEAFGLKIDHPLDLIEKY